MSPSGSPDEEFPLPPPLLVSERFKYTIAITNPMIPVAINVSSFNGANANPKKKKGHTSLVAIKLITIAKPTATTIPPPTVIPPVNHAGNDPNPF